MNDKEKTSIANMIEVRLNTAQIVATEQSPDWVNTHDYSSGYFIGRKQAAQELVIFLNGLLDKLNTKEG